MRTTFTFYQAIENSLLFSKSEENPHLFSCSGMKVWSPTLINVLLYFCSYYSAQTSSVSSTVFKENKNDIFISMLKVLYMKSCILLVLQAWQKIWFKDGGSNCLHAQWFAHLFDSSVNRRSILHISNQFIIIYSRNCFEVMFLKSGWI